MLMSTTEMNNGTENYLWYQIITEIQTSAFSVGVVHNNPFMFKCFLCFAPCYIFVRIVLIAV